VIIAESVVSFGFKVDWAISTYPIERGGFESYDRVATPFLAHVQFAAGSTKEKRLALLESLGQASADGNMTKYDVFTPEVIYTSVSIQHFDYDRKAAEGANLLKIDVFLQEIREQNTGGQDVKTPSGAAPQSGGNIQPETVPLPTPDPRFEVT